MIAHKRLILLILASCLILPAGADILDGGIAIPANSARWRLSLSIPLTRDTSPKTVAVRIREESGRCLLNVGGLPEATLDLLAPCDLQTMGAMYSFRPQVRFVSSQETPDEVWFEVVGALKYYPAIRSECSKTKRAIGIRWRRDNGKLRPYLELAPISDDIRGTRCPRAYVEVKGPLIEGLMPPNATAP